MLNYHKSQSTIEPVLIDTTSAINTVYIRKNVTYVERIDEETGEDRGYYEYDEAKISRESYNRYLTEKSQANLDYLEIVVGKQTNTEVDRISIDTMRQYYLDTAWDITKLNKLLELSVITQDEYDSITSPSED